MIGWDAARLAAESGASLLRDRPGPGPQRVAIDSREVRPGDLFVGLRGNRTDGGAHAAETLAAGAWGVLVAPEHAAWALQDGARASSAGAVLAHADPLRALQDLAAGWRAELGRQGARVLAVTGSTGKTSTKDILAAILAAKLRTSASPANRNTEIGLPLAILAAPVGTQALVLEMAMRGPGQIAELARIARPDVGVITNIGPVHLELLGSLQAIAAAKAELIAQLPAGATTVVPAREPLLAPHLREDLRTVTFGEDGQVRLLEHAGDRVLIADGSERIALRPSFHQAHNLRNLLAAVAAARAAGVTPSGDLEVEFSPMRGQRIALPGGVTVIDDCYNANPMSMLAALEDLAATAPGRRVAVLGDMLELGPDEIALHREVGEHARRNGVRLLITVGPLAAAMREPFLDADDTLEAHSVANAERAAALLEGLLRDGDTVLVKASRGVGLELVPQALAARRAVGA